MELIDAIRHKIASGDFEFSQHALDQSILRRISVQEVREAIGRGEVIEVQVALSMSSAVIRRGHSSSLLQYMN